MTEELIDVRCPECGRRFETEEPGEVECPCCGWEFACDGDGLVTDGEPDQEGPFEVNAEGELDSEGLLSTTCTGCGCVFEVGEPGVVPCPRCRRALDVDGSGQVMDGVVLFLTCPACKTVTPQSRVTHQGTCPACGCWFEWWDEEDLWYDYWAELAFAPPGCPNCGCREEHEDPRRLPFARCEDGRPRCLFCDWVFDPIHLRYKTRDEDDGAWYSDVGPDEVAPGLRPQDRWPNSGTHVVAADGSGGFRRIQDAIDCAWHGARIVVCPGQYPERVVLTKPIEIVGDGPPGSVRVMGADGPCLLVDVDRAEVRGLSFAGASASCAAVEIARGRHLLEDCSITSAGPACLLVHEASALPVLRRCRIHQGSQVGVLVAERALATLEECVICGHAGAGIELLTGGRLRLEHCQVLDNGAEGVYVRWDGEALLNNSVLAGNASANLAVEGGRVRLERCEVREGRAAGLRVRRGTAVLEECLVRANARAGVSVRRSGKVVLRQCRIREGRTDGVRVGGRSLVLLEECDLADNARAGLTVRGPGNVHLSRCRVAGNGSTAVSLAADAVLEVDGWEVNGPGRSRWDIQPGGLIRLVPPRG